MQVAAVREKSRPLLPRERPPRAQTRKEKHGSSTNLTPNNHQISKIHVISFTSANSVMAVSRVKRSRIGRKDQCGVSQVLRRIARADTPTPPSQHPYHVENNTPRHDAQRGAFVRHQRRSSQHGGEHDNACDSQRCSHNLPAERRWQNVTGGGSMPNLCPLSIRTYCT